MMHLDRLQDVGLPPTEETKATLKFRKAGNLEFRIFGTPDFRNSGIPEIRNFGNPGSRIPEVSGPDPQDFLIMNKKSARARPGISYP